MFDYGAALQGCARGDKSALRAIFEEDGSRLVAVAQRILRRRDLAEEAVQDAFVQIWKRASSYDATRGSARGWIYAIVRNRALNMVRDAGREDLASIEEIEALSDSQAVDGAFERLQSSSRLRHCLETLDETRRRSILLSYVAGYSHGEIAGRLAVPLGTAKAWIRRGLAALRDCMA